MLVLMVLLSLTVTPRSPAPLLRVFNYEGMTSLAVKGSEPEFQAGRPLLSTVLRLSDGSVPRNLSLVVVQKPQFPQCAIRMSTYLTLPFRYLKLNRIKWNVPFPPRSVSSAVLFIVIRLSSDCL